MCPLPNLPCLPAHHGFDFAHHRSTPADSVISKGVPLKVSDIDGQRRVIHVEQGKGGKACPERSRRDRYVPLPDRTLLELRNWYMTHRNPHWLFPAAGRPGNHDEFAWAIRPTPKGNVQDAFRAALKKSGVNKRASVRTLRHSYATHLVELGVNLRLIQEYLGQMLPSHKRAISDIVLCRTKPLGGKVYRCEPCDEVRYSYHSCKNRSCPKLVLSLSKDAEMTTRLVG